MIDYKKLIGVQFIPVADQCEIFKELYLQSIKEIPKKIKNTQTPSLEFVAIEKIVKSNLNKSWKSIDQIKKEAGCENLSNTRFGLALKEFLVIKKRAKINGVVYWVYLI